MKIVGNFIVGTMGPEDYEQAARAVRIENVGHLHAYVVFDFAVEEKRENGTWISNRVGNDGCWVPDSVETVLNTIAVLEGFAE